MAKPVERGFAVGLWSLGVALVAVAGLAAGVVWLDARRSNQLTELGDQLETLRQLVDTMQKQLDRHEEWINSTHHTKSPVRSEPSEEVEYEDQYDYDDEDSYEYEEEEEATPKATVKRTTILSDNTPSTDTTEHPVSETTQQTKARRRRDTRSQGVTVREERIKGTNNGPDQEMSQRTQHNPYQLRPSVYQEQRRPAESVVRLRHGGRNGYPHMDDVELVSQSSPEELEPEKPIERKVHLLAAHFVGDPSKCNARDQHCHGGFTMSHSHEILKYWERSRWMFELGLDTHFPLQNDGKLRIQKPGIYFVYAQVYYTAPHDRCGFHIKHNGEEVAQCTTTAIGKNAKRNTCFTAVILYLQMSDFLWVSEVEGGRNISLRGSHSFFGLIQLKPT